MPAKNMFDRGRFKQCVIKGQIRPSRYSGYHRNTLTLQHLDDQLSSIHGIHFFLLSIGFASAPAREQKKTPAGEAPTGVK
jgi:hypothetical protein